MTAHKLHHLSKSASQAGCEQACERDDSLLRRVVSGKQCWEAHQCRGDVGNVRVWSTKDFRCLMSAFKQRWEGVAHQRRVRQQQLLARMPRLPQRRQQRTCVPAELTGIAHT
jgi:hypothetical protein